MVFAHRPRAIARRRGRVRAPGRGRCRIWRRHKRQILQRDRPGRHRAAVDGAAVVAEHGAGQIFQHRPHLALHRMLAAANSRCGRSPWRRRRRGSRHACRSNCCAAPTARRFAPARRPPAATCGQWAPQRSAEASRPAFASMRVTPATCPGSPRMRGAGQRQLLVAEAVSIRRAGLDQRQRLQRLDRGARENRRRHVAYG